MSRDTCELPWKQPGLCNARGPSTMLEDGMESQYCSRRGSGTGRSASGSDGNCRRRLRLDAAAASEGRFDNRCCSVDGCHGGNVQPSAASTSGRSFEQERTLSPSFACLLSAPLRWFARSGNDRTSCSGRLNDVCAPLTSPKAPRARSLDSAAPCSGGPLHTDGATHDSARSSLDVCHDAQCLSCGSASLTEEQVAMTTRLFASQRTASHDSAGSVSSWTGCLTDSKQGLQSSSLMPAAGSNNQGAPLFERPPAWLSLSPDVSASLSRQSCKVSFGSALTTHTSSASSNTDQLPLPEVHMVWPLCAPSGPAPASFTVELRFPDARSLLLPAKSKLVPSLPSPAAMLQDLRLCVMAGDRLVADVPVTGLTTTCPVAGLRPLQVVTVFARRGSNSGPALSVLAAPGRVSKEMHGQLRRTVEQALEPSLRDAAAPHLEVLEAGAGCGGCASCGRLPVLLPAPWSLPYHIRTLVQEAWALQLQPALRDICYLVSCVPDEVGHLEWDQKVYCQTVAYMIDLLERSAMWETLATLLSHCTQEGVALVFQGEKITEDALSAARLQELLVNSLHDDVTVRADVLQRPPLKPSAHIPSGSGLLSRAIRPSFEVFGGSGSRPIRMPRGSFELHAVDSGRAWGMRTSISAARASIDLQELYAFYGSGGGAAAAAAVIAKRSPRLSIGGLFGTESAFQQAFWGHSSVGQDSVQQDGIGGWLDQWSVVMLVIIMCALLVLQLLRL